MGPYEKTSPPPPRHLALSDASQEPAVTVLGRAMSRSIELHQASFAELSRIAARGGHPIGHATLTRSARNNDSYHASLDSVLAISYLANIHPITLLRAVEKERVPGINEIANQDRVWLGYSLLGRYRRERRIPLGIVNGKKISIPLREQRDGRALVRWALVKYETDLVGLERLVRKHGHSTSDKTLRSILFGEHRFTPRGPTLDAIGLLTSLRPSVVSNIISN